MDAVLKKLRNALDTDPANDDTLYYVKLLFVLDRTDDAKVAWCWSRKVDRCRSTAALDECN